MDFRMLICENVSLYHYIVTSLHRCIVKENNRVVAPRQD